MKGKKLLLPLMILGILALGVTSYLVWLHFNTDVTGFCQEGGTFDCVSVNQSKYAYIFDVPMSIWGLIFYSGFFLLTLALYLGLDLRKIHYRFKRRHAYWIMFLIPLFGTLFSLRLTYIEAFILKAWCPFCVMQQVIVFIMLIFAYLLFKQRPQ